MDTKLYKVKIETELMVTALNEKEALSIAIKNAPSEVAQYGRGNPMVVKSISDIPFDWRDVIPYGSERAVQETRKCKEIVGDKLSGDVDVEEIVKIQQSAKGSKNLEQDKEVIPETRPDPVPKELKWHDTTSGRPLPHLRFKM